MTLGFDFVFLIDFFFSYPRKTKRENWTRTWITGMDNGVKGLNFKGNLSFDKVAPQRTWKRKSTTGDASR